MANLIVNSSIYGQVGIIPYPVRDGATEALEFFTDVAPSYTNQVEERAQMRAIPRQYFQYAHDASFDYMQEIYNAVRANIRGDWLIPIWFEAQAVTAALGQQLFAVDTLLHDLRANSHAVIFKSICEWQVVEIASIAAASITTVEECALQGRAYVIPLRVGKLAGNVNASPTGYNNKFELQYYVQDVLEGLTETVTQYNGKDFYSVPYLMQGAGSVQIVQAEQQSDFSVGGIFSETPWLFSQYTKEYRFEGQGASEYRALKNWFYRRGGRFREFYSPSFESNLQNISTGTVGSTFRFKDEGYTDNLFSNIKRVGFRLANGTWQVRTVTGAANLGGGESQISLNSPLNVPAKDIELASFVSLNRLDTDRIDIRLGQNGTFKSAAAVMELSE